MVELNHTIVHAKDAATSAQFMSEILGFAPPRRFGPFMSTDEPFIVEHYAFLVSEAEFDEIFARIQARGLDYWADPRLANKGQINRNDGGRGVYFLDSNGHYLEIITRPYGSGG